MRAWRAFWELLLPPGCAGCGGAPAGAGALCPRCDARLPRLGGPVAVGGLEACVAAVALAEPVEAWVHRFKYPAPGLTGLDPAPVAALRALAREAARRAPGPAPDLVVPVPLHPRRLRGRGFNPAALLARVVARERRARLDCAGLRRLRDTPSQTELGRAERRRNVRGAFRARRALPPRVWLVDDVVTTGATLAEAARALRAGGARRVVGVCVAHRTAGAPLSRPPRPSPSRGSPPPAAPGRRAS